MTVLRIAGIIVICLFSALILRNMKYEHVYLPIIAAIIIIFAYMLSGDVSESLGVIREISEESEFGNYIAVLFKALGISYIVAITADMCRSAGEDSLARIAETTGKFELLALSLPLASELIEAAKGLI